MARSKHSVLAFGSLFLAVIVTWAFVLNADYDFQSKLKHQCPNVISANAPADVVHAVADWHKYTGVAINYLYAELAFVIVLAIVYFARGFNAEVNNEIMHEDKSPWRLIQQNATFVIFILAMMHYLYIKFNRDDYWGKLGPSPCISSSNAEDVNLVAIVHFAFAISLAFYTLMIDKSTRNCCCLPFGICFEKNPRS